MKWTLIVSLVAAFLAGTVTVDAWARGGSGIGSGGARPSAGTASRPSAGASVSRTPSLSRTPSMPSASRPAPSISRPTPAVSRPAITDGRPGSGTSLPSLGGSRPDLGALRPSGSQRPSASPIERPSPGQLQDFLDLPGRPGESIRPTGPERPMVVDRPDIGDRIPGGREDRIDAIRDRWNRPMADRPFDHNWWVQHPTSDIHWHWHAGWNRYPASWWWRPCTWGALGGWFAWSWTNPYNYNYGATIVYRDNYIYVNDRQVATVEAYHEQATKIARNVPDEPEVEQIDWMPLGVFAISEESATDKGMLIQLAVSREGVISGTFYNEITDSVRPLIGSVDQASQRAAWRFADDEDSEIIMETGIYNLTQDESTALVHFGPGQVQTWLLVRLPEAEEESPSVESK